MNLQENINRIKEMMGLNEQSKNPLDFLTDPNYMDYNRFNYTPQEKKSNFKNIKGLDANQIKKLEVSKDITYPYLFNNDGDKEVAVLDGDNVYFNQRGGIPTIRKTTKKEFEEAIQNNNFNFGGTALMLEDNEKEYMYANTKIAQGDLILKERMNDLNKNLPSVELSSLLGSPIILDIWATWCHGCKIAIKDKLNPLYNKYGSKGLKFFYLSVDTDLNKLKDMIDNLGISYATNAVDTKGRGSDVLKTYNVSQFPTTLLLDKEGNIVKDITFRVSKEEIDKLIESLL